MVVQPKGYGSSKVLYEKRSQDHIIWSLEALIILLITRCVGASSSSPSSSFVHRKRCFHIILGGTRSSTFKMANVCHAWSIMVNGGRRNRCCSGRVIVAPWGRPCWHSRYLKAWRCHQSTVQVPMTSPYQLETTSTGKSNIFSAAETRTETPCWFHSRSEANHSTFHHWRPGDSSTTEMRGTLRLHTYQKKTRKRNFMWWSNVINRLTILGGSRQKSFWQIDKQPDMVTVKDRRTESESLKNIQNVWTGQGLNFQCLPPSPMPYSAWSGEGLG